MTSRDRKITRIGNSHGARPPTDSLERLSWEGTAGAMAASAEDWSDWDTTAGDGLVDPVPNPAEALNPGP